MMNLKIEYVKKEDLKPYANNAKVHTAEQIEQIKNSIKEFGFNDPIAIWKDNEIIEGHGRLLAVMEIDEIKDVPIIRLDELTDEQRRAYMLAHNKLTMNTGFDYSILEIELDNIEIDMEQFGFDYVEWEHAEPDKTESAYTEKVEGLEYEPSGNDVNIKDCFDEKKYRELIKQIGESSLTEDEKSFLRLGATRHIIFYYSKIADYYAGKASVEMQNLMESQALVIIDFDSAIKHGYTKLHNEIEQMYLEDEHEK